jgi:DNA-binding NarL/FixJ family response regulator
MMEIRHVPGESRDDRVTTMLKAGYSTKMIAEELGLNPRTVQRIYDKLLKREVARRAFHAVESGDQGS